MVATILRCAYAFVRGSLAVDTPHGTLKNQCCALHWCGSRATELRAVRAAHLRLPAPGYKSMNESKLQEFMGRLVGDMGGAAMMANVVLGNELGLYRAMADGAGE